MCEDSFNSTGPWWHLYTNGKNTPVFLVDTEDLTYAMNLMARCVHEINGITVVSFELMNNHIHIALAGSENDAERLFKLFRRRLARYFNSKSRVLPDTFQVSLKRIPDLKTLRNIIVYINRNGYVSDSSSTPFSYRWGTGRYYFNDFPIESRYGDLVKNERRVLLQSSDVRFPEDFRIIEGYISPPSYCSIKFGMALFRDAHHYFNMVSRSIASYCEVASEMDDWEFLTDSELFSEVLKILRGQYNISKLNELTKAQKLDIARTLHFRFHSSNTQIARTLGISLYDINQMFNN